MFRILILLLIFVWFAPGSTRAQSDQKNESKIRPKIESKIRPKNENSPSSGRRIDVY